MKVSVVCPFYNEDSIIKGAVTELVSVLDHQDFNYELILVNDGSTDESISELKGILNYNTKIKLVSYDYNQGRGYALKTGIKESTGDIIITTEIDLSWGKNIIKDIVNKFKENPHLDAVIASPNLKGGGYYP